MCADEGLQKEGTELSQIPTYVTAVPDGTEKVRPPTFFFLSTVHTHTSMYIYIYMTPEKTLT